MASDESNSSPKIKPDWEFNLPVFTERMKEHWPIDISWAEAVRQMAPMRDYYMKHFYCPEQRLRDKNPKRFVMH